MPFNIGLSGLNAAAADLKTTGNNIANVATTGFKQSRTEFGDIFTRSYGTISRTNSGAGVRVVATTQQFTQGTLEFSGNSLDLSITGRGFFVLNSAGNNDNVYTRAGAIQVDNEGYLVNNGAPPLRIQGFPPVDPSDPNSAFQTGLLSDMQLNLADSPPRSSSEVNAQINLRSDATEPLNNEDPPVRIPFDTTDPDSYNFSTSTTIYDSLGTPLALTTFFVKTDVAGAWEMYTNVDGVTVTPDDPPEDNPIGPTTVSFDTNGKMISPALLTQPDLDDPSNTHVPIELDLTGYMPLSNNARLGSIDPETGEGDGIIKLDLSGTTQYGQKYAVSSLEQDGYTTGRITGVDADEEGVLFVRYSNGRALPLGQVALADFDNTQGLQQIGDTSWAETTASGNPVIFSPGTGSLGNIQGGALETSNVDLATELVHLITAQRNYQANSKTISAADTITQAILNIQ